MLTDTVSHRLFRSFTGFVDINGGNAYSCRQPISTSQIIDTGSSLVLSTPGAFIFNIRCNRGQNSLTPGNAGDGTRFGMLYYAALSGPGADALNSVCRTGLLGLTFAPNGTVSFASRLGTPNSWAFPNNYFIPTYWDDKSQRNDFASNPTRLNVTHIAGVTGSERQLRYDILSTAGPLTFNDCQRVVEIARKPGGGTTRRVGILANGLNTMAYGTGAGRHSFFMPSNGRILGQPTQTWAPYVNYYDSSGNSLGQFFGPTVPQEYLGRKYNADWWGVRADLDPTVIATPPPAARAYTVGATASAGFGSIIHHFIDRGIAPSAWPIISVERNLPDYPGVLIDI
jgi:hypothetical protein